MEEIVREMAGRPEIASILAGWPEAQHAVIAEALTIQAIPAPTFDEFARAGYVEARFREIGLADVSRDEVGNVYGCTPGGGRPAVLISAHLDTVFPAGTSLITRRDEGIQRIYGPGLGDNSLGLAALIALAAALHPHAAALPADLWWVATVGEEGLGDLRGMRRAFQHLAGQIGVGLVLEGIGLGRVYHAGLGVRRLRVIVNGPGGHSWLHADRPSAIHHLLLLGSALVEAIRPPEEPRSSFNIGLIEGGTSINTRAAQASLAIDLRSVDSGTLAELETEVRGIVARFADDPGLTVVTEVVGDRPSAMLPVEHPLVRAAQAVLEYLGVAACAPEIGSTDANILLAGGVPAVCIGITTGGNAHSLDEYIDTEPVACGMSQATLLLLLVAEHVAEWGIWDAA